MSQWEVLYNVEVFRYNYQRLVKEAAKFLKSLLLEGVFQYNNTSHKSQLVGATGVLVYAKSPFGANATSCP
jgi:hypothetical protein